MSNQLQSEGEQLDAILDELQREHQIKEVSGWCTGFSNLDRALDGILPGLYLLIGPPGCGKTSFAKQLLDQIVVNNAVAGIFFTFTETKKELRIRTLARLSEMESREIRRGSAFLLHWYGVPRLGGEQASQMSASWEKLRRSALEAKNWLDRIYLRECNRKTDMREIEQCLKEVKAAQQTDRGFVVIDDCQQLAPSDLPLAERLEVIAETLYAAARDLCVPILAVASVTASGAERLPSFWGEKICAADVIAVVERDQTTTKQLSQSHHVINLEIVRNRDGENGKLAFEFTPALANFVEIS